MEAATPEITLKQVQAQLTSHLTKTITTYIVITFGAAIIACVAFYYNTLNTLDNQKQQIESVQSTSKSNEGKINGTEVDLGIINTQQTNILNRLDKMETKVDAIYDLLVRSSGAN